jgi:hypothetical protein
MALGGAAAPGSDGSACPYRTFPVRSFAVADADRAERSVVRSLSVSLICSPICLRSDSGTGMGPTEAVDGDGHFAVAHAGVTVISAFTFVCRPDDAVQAHLAVLEAHDRVLELQVLEFWDC